MIKITTKHKTVWLMSDIDAVSFEQCTEYNDSTRTCELKKDSYDVIIRTVSSNHWIEGITKHEVNDVLRQLGLKSE